MDDVHLLRLEPLQTALDAFQDRIARPVRRALHSSRMPAFREQEIIFSPISNRATDQFFAPVITLRRVDDVESGVERALQQLLDRLDRCFFESNFRAAKPEDADLHVCFAETTL